MKLSVVIPVYRVETTINRCVASVLNQTFADFELILVDDGSPDTCPPICDKWAKDDQRIKVIHKPNGGLSDARNAGIRIARGEYITFVDSDDYIEQGTLASLMQTLSQHPDIDILEYPAYVYFGSRRQHRLEFPHEHAYSDMERYWYEEQAYLHTYAWNKIYKRRLFDKVIYPVGMLFEDVHTLPQLLKHAHLVATTNKGLYYYCANANGITATADGNALRMLLQPHVEIIKNARRRDQAFSRYYMHVLNIQMDVYEQTGDKPTLPFVRQNTRALNGKQKLKAIALNTLGIEKLCKVNKVIHKVWRNR